jgi:hypothetical protein
MKAEDLKEYGKVELCEVQGDTFHIKITEGFTTNAVKTFELIGKIDKAIGDEYPIIKKCVTDNNIFDYVLGKREVKE